MVNLLPSIKDGQVTWTTMRVEAQQYIVEGMVDGLYKCVNTLDENDWFPSSTTSCLYVQICVCKYCGAEGDCDGPCLNPLCPSNDPDANYCSCCQQQKDDYDVCINPTCSCSPYYNGTSDPGGGGNAGGGGNPGSGGDSGSDSGSDPGSDPVSDPGYDPLVSPPIISVSLSCPNVVELLDPYNISLTVNPSGATITSVKYLINDQYELQNGTSLSCEERAKKAGHWSIKAVVNGTHTSNVVNVDVNYPDANTIMSNGVVSSNMADLWQETKNAASANGRSERGCWIYINTTSMTYECGTTIVGPNTEGCAGTSGQVDMGFRSESLSSSPIIGGKYTVAFFHTHTPLTFCPSGNSRVVGPSDYDTDFAASEGVPGFVYDYNGTWSYSDYRINGGHSIDASSQLFIFGPAKRETP
jgi:hypothetical protein